MNKNRIYPLKYGIAAVAACFMVAVASADEPRKPVNPGSDKIEVDARGPVHEAFAQPFQPNPVPHEPVAKKPPQPIPEEPAAEKPEGKNVQWIPGYWQWDPDRTDFIWVSGFWRDLPVGRRWIMGYWTETPEGNRWVSGHFAAAKEQDNHYVPEPPENKDAGPTTEAPDENSLYIPGSYFYTDDGYKYRDGYWTDFQADQVWVPARYLWTPHGYLFASGYWDYPLARRGLLFAPVYFNAPLWQTAGWAYQPSYPIGYDGLYNSLFVGIGWGHYFFGDYYNRSYLNYGITPWFWYSHRWYDPLWNHDRWANRGNPQWGNRFQENYIARVNGREALPARTFAAQSRAGYNGPRTVHTFAQVRESGRTLAAVNADQRTAHIQAARQMVNQSQQLSRTVPSVTTSNRINGNAPVTGIPRTYPSAPRTAPSNVPRLSTGNVPHMEAPHIPTGTIANLNRPSFPAPHPGGFPGGHGNGQPHHK